MKKDRPASIYILYFFFLLAVFVVAAEVLLRLFWTPPKFQFIVEGNDPVYHHSNREDHELGAMDVWRKPITPRKSADELRVFLLGDSFAMGMVDAESETIGNYLQIELAERFSDRKVEVWNMAMISYSTMIYYLVAKNLVLPNDPDLVVLMYDASDPADDAVYTPLAKFDSEGRPVAIRPLPDYEMLPLKLEMAWIVAKRYLQNGFKFNSYQQVRANRYVILRDPIEKWDDALADSMKYLGMTARLCREKGVPLVVVRHPNVMALKYKKPFTKWLADWGFESGVQYKGDNLDAALLEAAKKYDFPFQSLEKHVLDLEKDWLKKHVPPTFVYREKDAHFTEAGHLLIAKPIADFIAANLPAEKEKP